MKMKTILMLLLVAVLNETRLYKTFVDVWQNVERQRSLRIHVDLLVILMPMARVTTKLPQKSTHLANLQNTNVYALVVPISLKFASTLDLRITYLGALHGFASALI